VVERRPALAITLGALNPRSYLDAAVAADDLGFDAVFMSDHLIFPVRMEGELSHGSPPPPLSTPLTDPLAYLSFLAGQTSHVKLGTFVYLMGLRHPFVAARAFSTLDHVSRGRALVGVGVGWLTSEWDALGIDPRHRGARLDEAIAVTRRLWTEEAVDNDGPCFPFEPVRFEPKPFSPGGPPIMVGGESARALDRAARMGDGWFGMTHTPASARRAVDRLTSLRDQYERSDQFSVTVMGQVEDEADLVEWGRAGVDRIVVKPWTSSRDAVPAMESLARKLGLTKP
jgi:probable F420-dependent oxidoreductase